MSIRREYSYEIGGTYFCEGRPLSCDNPVHIEVQFRIIPYEDQEIRVTARGLVPQTLLLSHDTAGPTLSSILSSLGIPSQYQTQLIRVISYQVRSLSFLETCPVCHCFLVPGVVTLIRAEEGEVIGVDEIHELALAMGELLPVDVVFVPATESSIEALEEVVRDGGGGSSSMDQCAICFDELVDGSEVSRMPCGHVYHGDCIVPWLKTSHLCPLCRYEMPTN